MINSVTANPIAKPKTTKTSIFYVNDLHGQTMKMEKIYNASKCFDQFVPSSKTDKLKLCSGDTMLGDNSKSNKIASKFLELIGVSATSVGNHECDGDSKQLFNLTKDKNYKILAANLKVADSNPMSKRIEKSYIQEVDGTRYGIIGTAPSDLFTRIANVDNYKDFKVDNYDDTIKAVQAEVDKLQKQGVDKIIVVSHTGNANEKRLAQETSGIDVILGGHSHELIKDIKEGENLLYGKDGNPVVITQAGKDADNFGVLNLEFDENGVITKVQNNVTPTKGFRRNLVMTYFSEMILGKPETVGTIKAADPEPANRLAEENPHADFVADSMKDFTGADIAVLGSANLRNTFETGAINTRDVSSIVPFKNGMVVAPLSEKTLVDALKFGAHSLVSAGTKPGILQVSGLNYTMNKAGELVSAEFVDKNGNKQALDVKNPSEDKTFKVALDTYYANGRDGFEMLKCMDKVEKSFDEDKDKMVSAYIKKLGAAGKEIEVKADNRIQIID
ncbi:MAG: bifunctional metallophosphatase/5'-nucleotidase [Candidatus Gastranaerophilaceae bacterium]